MYDPISGNDDDQYVELYNRGSTSVDLGGWQLTDAISYSIPSNTAPGCRQLPGDRANCGAVARNYPEPQRQRTAWAISAGKLSTNGEHLALTDAGGAQATNGRAWPVTNMINIDR